MNDAGTTGANITDGTTLNTTAAGTATVTATITNGLTASSDYTQDFQITVSAAPPVHIPVTNITDVPQAATVGTPITLSGTVAPSNATNKTIVWSGTGVSGNQFTPTSEGTTVITATITNGLTDSSDYTQNFNITVSGGGGTPPPTIYTVTFDANDGSVSPATVQTGSDGKVQTLPTPTRTGYSFDGWFTAATGGTQVTAQTIFTANTTVYAHWTVVKDNTGIEDKTDVEDKNGAGDKTVSVLVSISGADSKKIADKAYTGKSVKPVPTLTFKKATLKQGTDYTVSYKNNTKIGKATVTITGKGKYTGTKTITFNIIPQKASVSKVVAGKNQLKVIWKKANAAQKITKYEVRYKIKGAAKWQTKTASAKSASLTITKLQKNKTYQIQVRTYKTVSKTKYHSAWSAIKTSGKVK